MFQPVNEVQKQLAEKSPIELTRLIQLQARESQQAHADIRRIQEKLNTRGEILQAGGRWDKVVGDLQDAESRWDNAQSILVNASEVLTAKLTDQLVEG